VSRHIQAGGPGNGFSSSLPLPGHPPARTSPATRAGVGEHVRVRPCTAAKKEGGSLVRGTKESDRAASLAPAETEVRAGAVLPSGGPEHQATSAVPKPTDNTRLARVLADECRVKPCEQSRLSDAPMSRNRWLFMPAFWVLGRSTLGQKTQIGLLISYKTMRRFNSRCTLGSVA
jgi:hypothetical protein